MPIREGIEISEEDAIEYDKANSDFKYWDQRQYIEKIKLNSLYGSLGNQFFRFYDVRMAESTTATGRDILLHQSAKVNEILVGEYDYHGKTVLYGDSVAGDTSVETDTGPRLIKDLFTTVDYMKGDKEYSNVDRQALTYVPQEKDNQFRPIKYVVRHKVNKKMYRVWIGNTRYLDVTEDHSLIGANSNSENPRLVEVKPTEVGKNDVDSLILRKQNGYTLISPTRIEEIEYDDYVYDIEVDDTHMFYANDLLVHNTDSTYFSTLCDNKRESVLVADRIAELINDSFEPFMKETYLCTPGFSNLIRCARETVADRGIFVKKKMYLLHVVDNEGEASDKLKVMGLATKRTTLPKEIAKYLNDAIQDFLKGETWEELSLRIVKLKEELKETKDLFRLGIPKGIKKVEEYTENYEKDHLTRLPGHVAAAIHWNKCMDVFGDKVSPIISSGMKIKVYYLTEKYGRFKSMAIPGDIDMIPSWFTHNYQIDKDAQIERLVNGPLENIAVAIGQEVPSKQGMFADDILGFDNQNREFKPKPKKPKKKKIEAELDENLLGF